jgi:hypothetical protein
VSGKIETRIYENWCLERLKHGYMKIGSEEAFFSPWGKFHQLVKSKIGNVNYKWVLSLGIFHS